MQEGIHQEIYTKKKEEEVKESKRNEKRAYAPLGTGQQTPQKKA